MNYPEDTPFLDSSRLISARSDYKHLQEYLELLIGSIVDYALVLCDPESLITGWNPGAERIFGYTVSEIVGQQAAVLFTLGDREKGEVEQEIHTALMMGSAEDDRWHLRKDGSCFWGSGVLTALRTDSGELRGFVKVMRDFSKRKDAEREMQHRANSAEVALDRSKEEIRGLVAGLINAQEEESRRIARELHDDLGQQLAVLEMNLTQLRQAANLPETVSADLEDSIVQVGKMSNDLRSVSHRLHPAILQDLGLEPALHALVDEFEQTYDLAVHLSCGNLQESVPLTTGTVIYRIAQEALRNIGRHAPGAHVIIRVSTVDAEVRLHIQDDGPGFTPDTVRTGLGLISMRERAQLVGGTVEVRTMQGRGTTVAVRVPLSK